MQRLLAVILAGGSGERLNILSQRRAKPAVPFAGKYRIIDFTLSNCINSGVYNVIVLTQYQPVSLTEHIGIGAPWGLVPPDRSIRLLQPYLERDGKGDWYKGTADAVFQNLDRIEAEDADEVLILSGDHVYKMDYSAMLDFHRDKKADVTLAAIRMPEGELHRFGTVVTDENGKVTRFQEKVKNPQSNMVSMGVYIFSMAILRRCMESCTGTDFGRHIFPKLLKTAGVYAYEYEGYWRDIGTVDSYWQTSMEMLDMSQSFLADGEWRIYTKEVEGPPAKVGSNATVTNLLLSHACKIEGSIEHSVISPGVHIGEGTVVKDSIIMSDTHIGPDCVIDRVIIDKEVIICKGSHIGWGDDFQPNKRYPKVLDTGVTLVGKQAFVPAGSRIGRNCIIYDNVTENDYPGEEVLSGETIRPKPRRPRRAER